MVDTGAKSTSAGGPAATLRELAERRLGGATAASSDSATDEPRLLHELQVHDVELQLQNEQLQQEHAEAAAARDRYARLFELSPVGVIEVAADGSIVEANRAAARMLQATKEALAGARLDRQLAPASVPAWQALLAGAGQAARGHAELALARPGSPTTVWQADSACDAATGTVLVTLVDISERSRVQAAEREAALTLAKANRAKNEFLSRMSHELRTPLNAVLGFAQLLLADTAHPLDPAQHARVADIERAGRQLLAVIEESMDIARIESGHIDLRPHPLSARALFDDCLPLVTPLALAAGVVVVPPSLDAGDCWLRADASRLRQVLIKLLSRAVQRSPPGGEVSLACHCGGDGDTVTIAVSDSGAAGGEGLGEDLGIVPQLVDAMGGTLRHDSVGAHGTRVSLGLPRVATPGAGAVPASKGSAAAGAGKSRRVLFIGDVQADRDLIEAAVHALPGVTLTTACDGQSGIPTARVLHPDLVIVGFGLPDMAAAEALRALRRQPQTSGVPCVVLSADAAPGAAAEARAAGFLELWPKPLGGDFLRSRLRALLG